MDPENTKCLAVSQRPGQLVDGKDYRLPKDGKEMPVQRPIQLTKERSTNQILYNVQVSKEVLDKLLKSQDMQYDPLHPGMFQSMSRPISTAGLPQLLSQPPLGFRPIHHLHPR